MKRLILISLVVLSLLAGFSESQINPDPESEIPPFGDERDSNEAERRKALEDVQNLLRKLIDVASQGSNEELKKRQISVVNDIEGKNVVSDIKGTSINGRIPKIRRNNQAGTKKGRKLLEQAAQRLRVTRERNAMAQHQFSEETFTQMQALIDSLANCQRISESIASREIRSQKELKEIRLKIKKELLKAKKIHNRMAPDTPNGIEPPFGAEMTMNLGNAIDRALKTCNKFTGMNIKSKDDLMEMNIQLEDEIENAMEIGQEMTRKIEGKADEQVEDEKEAEEQSDSVEQDDNQRVKELERAIALANKVDDDTLRRFAMKNKIRGENIVTRQDFTEVNFRNSKPNNIIIEKRTNPNNRWSQVESWNVPQSFDRRKDYTSPDQHYPTGQPRYFWDEAEKADKEIEEDDERTPPSAGKVKKALNDEPAEKLSAADEWIKAEEEIAQRAAENAAETKDDEIDAEFGKELPAKKKPRRKLEKEAGMLQPWPRNTLDFPPERQREEEARQNVAKFKKDDENEENDENGRRTTYPERPPQRPLGYETDSEQEDEPKQRKWVGEEKAAKRTKDNKYHPYPLKSIGWVDIERAEAGLPPRIPGKPKRNTKAKDDEPGVTPEDFFGIDARSTRLEKQSDEEQLVKRFGKDPWKPTSPPIVSLTEVEGLGRKSSLLGKYPPTYFPEKGGKKPKIHDDDSQPDE